MREEHKLNKAIKQNGVDTQSDILDELKRRYPQYVEELDKKRAPVSRRKKTFVFALATVAACVAIIVPCAVLLPNHNNGANNGGNESVRYCAQGEYEKSYSEYTIGEYRESNNRDFLYFDWYEIGEDRETVCYISNSNNEVLGLEESIYLPETDEFVQFSITKENVFLDEFAPKITSCDKEHTVDDHTVKWSVNIDVALCIFEDGGYRYFIRILPGEDENRLFELVAELLGKK